jgi:hypothetical protein
MVRESRIAPDRRTARVVEASTTAGQSGSSLFLRKQYEPVILLSPIRSRSKIPLSDPKNDFSGSACPEAPNAPEAITAWGGGGMGCWVVRMVRKFCGVY